MIRSILDTDLYKFTTSYAYFKLYPEAIGTFTFNDRAKTEFDEDFLEDLKAELKALERISLSDDEFRYMITNCKYIPQNYFEWLKGFRLKNQCMARRGAPPPYQRDGLYVQGYALRDSYPCYGIGVVPLAQ